MIENLEKSLSKGAIALDASKKVAAPGRRIQPEVRRLVQPAQRPQLPQVKLGLPRAPKPLLKVEAASSAIASPAREGAAGKSSALLVADPNSKDRPGDVPAKKVIKARPVTAARKRRMRLKVHLPLLVPDPNTNSQTGPLQESSILQRPKSGVLKALPVARSNPRVQALIPMRPMQSLSMDRVLSYHNQWLQDMQYLDRLVERLDNDELDRREEPEILMWHPTPRESSSLVTLRESLRTGPEPARQHLVDISTAAQFKLLFSHVKFGMMDVDDAIQDIQRGLESCAPKATDTQAQQHDYALRVNYWRYQRLRCHFARREYESVAHFLRLYIRFTVFGMGWHPFSSKIRLHPASSEFHRLSMPEVALRFKYDELLTAKMENLKALEKMSLRECVHPDTSRIALDLTLPFDPRFTRCKGRMLGRLRNWIKTAHLEFTGESGICHVHPLLRVLDKNDVVYMKTYMDAGRFRLVRTLLITTGTMMQVIRGFFERSDNAALAEAILKLLRPNVWMRRRNLCEDLDSVALMIFQHVKGEHARDKLRTEAVRDEFVRTIRDFMKLPPLVSTTLNGSSSHIVASSGTHAHRHKRRASIKRATNFGFSSAWLAEPRKRPKMVFPGGSKIDAAAPRRKHNRSVFTPSSSSISCSRFRPSPLTRRSRSSSLLRGGCKRHFSSSDSPSIISDSASASILSDGQGQDKTKQYTPQSPIQNEHVPLTYQIPVSSLHDTMQASLNGNDVHFSHTMYRGPSDEKVVVHYCRNLQGAESAARFFANERALGFDIEWKPNARPTAGAVQNASLIQLASESRIGLFHISLFKPKKGETLVPPTLKSILESENILKVGVAVLTDAQRLSRYLNITCRGLIELSHLYKLVTYAHSDPSKVNKRLVSLKQQVEEHLQLPLYKGDVRTSDWSYVLNYKQTNYAAADAYAGLRLFDTLEGKRLSMKPTPPFPAFAEAQLPLQLHSNAPNTTDGVVDIAADSIDFKVRKVATAKFEGELPTRHRDANSVPAGTSGPAFTSLEDVRAWKKSVKGRLLPSRSRTLTDAKSDLDDFRRPQDASGPALRYHLARGGMRMRPELRERSESADLRSSSHNLWGTCNHFQVQEVQLKQERSESRKDSKTDQPLTNNDTQFSTASRSDEASPAGISHVSNSEFTVSTSTQDISPHSGKATRKQRLFSMIANNPRSGDVCQTLDRDHKSSEHLTAHTEPDWSRDSLSEGSVSHLAYELRQRIATRGISELLENRKISTARRENNMHDRRTCQSDDDQFGQSGNVPDVETPPRLQLSLQVVNAAISRLLSNLYERKKPRAAREFPAEASYPRVRQPTSTRLEKTPRTRSNSPTTTVAEEAVMNKEKETRLSPSLIPESLNALHNDRPMNKKAALRKMVSLGKLSKEEFLRLTRPSYATSLVRRGPRKSTVRDKDQAPVPGLTPPKSQTLSTVQLQNLVIGLSDNERRTVLQEKLDQGEISRAQFSVGMSPTAVNRIRERNLRIRAKRLNTAFINAWV